MNKKKLLAGILTGAMVLSSGMTVFADTEYTEETIDDSKKGSITLVKQLNPDGKWFEAHGLSGEGIEGALPVEGIEFYAIQIADIEMFNDHGVVGTFYSELSDSFLTIVDQAGYNLQYDEKDKNGKYYYAADTLQNAVQAVVETSGQGVLEEFAKSGAAFDLTDETGTTSMASLDLGMYLIAETDVSGAHVKNSYLTGEDTYTHLATGDTDKSLVLADGPDGDIWDDTDATSITISSKVTPYLISVPTTNTATVDGHAPGTVWMYDLTSYPKNAGVDVTKMVVDADPDDADTLRTYEDYEIGDTIKQVIFSGVSPLIEGKKHEKFIMADTMTESLTMGAVTSVKLGKRTGNPTKYSDFAGFTELAASDYTLTADEHGFRVNFTSAGLAKLDALSAESLVVVTFETVLNEKAAIGTERQNMNQPELTWKNSYEAEHSITGNKIYFFTYEISLTKEGLQDPTQAVFRIQRTTDENEPDGIDMAVVEEKAGVYHLYCSVTDNADAIVTTVSPDADGNLIVKGVDSKRYAIVEVATQEGYNLLKDGFDIVITAPDKGSASLAAPKKDSHRDGTVTATVDTKGGSSDLYTKDGVVYITILNNWATSLHTGGAGNAAYYIAAAALLLFGAGVVVVTKKKRA